MTCSTSSSLVEHVGKAMDSGVQASPDINEDLLHYYYHQQPDSYDALAKLVIRSTLEYLRSHVTKDMILAARRVKHLRVPKRSSEEVMFVAMIDAAIGEMEK
jgi:hypothetical protein